MNRSRNLLLFVTLAMAAATSALAQTATPVSAPGGSVTSASIPDLSGIWNHPAFPWFEPPASGPGPVTNKSRGPQRPGGASGSPNSPSLEGGREQL